MATPTVVRLRAAFASASPGGRSLRALLLVLALLVGSCGQVASPILGSGDARTRDQPAAVPPGAARKPGLSAAVRSEARAVATSAAGAGESSGRQRVIQGAAAVDPRAAGTVVAHVKTAEIVARLRPDADAPIVASFQPTTGGPEVFAGIGRPRDGWLQVLLPIRPNGTTGWIQTTDVELTINPYRIEVDASAYRLTIYRYGREQLTTTVAIGNGDTPTPIGEFFLIELLRPSNPDGPYGPFAYGLSGYSETLQNFNGGAGIIGIHGTNQPQLLGQDVSHGCIRVANPTIAEMTEFLPLGTPVAIFRTDKIPVVDTPRPGAGEIPWGW